MIKNVVFDVGNVLVSFRWRELMEDLGFSDDVKKVFAKTVFGNPLWDELDRGVLDESEILRKMREEDNAYGKEFDLIWANIDKIVEPYDYAIDMMDKLKAKGLKIYLLSNYPRRLFELHTKCGKFPFIDRIDGKIVSGFVRCIKPDREIYECLLKEYDLKSEECVFLDDREDNIEAAEQIGMSGIVFKEYEQAWAELERMI